MASFTENFENRRLIGSISLMIKQKEFRRVTTDFHLGGTSCETVKPRLFFQVIGKEKNQTSCATLLRYIVNIRSLVNM